MKRAQRCRLEDQRGTKINFELPDFLKDKEIFTINKLRKVKPMEPIPYARTVEAGGDSLASIARPPGRPQPAPRLSILKANASTGGGGRRSSSPIDGDDAAEQIDEEHIVEPDHSAMDATNKMHSYVKGPPPLPPKPKILPIKPSNWGQSPNKSTATTTTADAWN